MRTFSVVVLCVFLVLVSVFSYLEFGRSVERHKDSMKQIAQNTHLLTLLQNSGTQIEKDLKEQKKVLADINAKLDRRNGDVGSVGDAQ